MMDTIYVIHHKKLWVEGKTRSQRKLRVCLGRFPRVPGLRRWEPGLKSETSTGELEEQAWQGREREREKRDEGRQAGSRRQHAARSPCKNYATIAFDALLSSLSCFFCRTSIYFPHFLARPRSCEAGIASAIRIS